ncbi:MAG: hypothetical protein QMC62_11865 [Alteromonadaceae bacterium]
MCNFVVNLAKGIDVEEDELYIMMDIIKSLTPSHIRAVQLYNRPFWFTDRFRELAVFWDTVGLGELRLDVKVYKELAIIFHKDRDTNVLHHNIELIDDDVSNYHDHWKLVINQLDNLLLVSKPSDEIKGYSSVKVTRENGKASFKVNLKRQLSMRGFLLLDLIEG